MGRWYVAAGVGVLLVVGVIGLSSWLPKKGRAVVPTQCPSWAVKPNETLAGAALKAVLPAGAALEVDGYRFSDGLRVAAGRHHVVVSKGALLSLDVWVDVVPFSNVFIEVREDAGALVGVISGARCSSCGASIRGPLEVKVSAGAAALEQSAQALARGQWSQALEQLERVPRSDRVRPRVVWQLEAARALAGAPLESAELRATVASASVQPRVLEEEFLTSSWNSLTERFGAASRALVSEAPGVVSATSERVDALSREFARATEARELDAQRSAVAAMGVAFEAFAKDAVALHPTDCAWVARVGRAVGAR